MQSKRVSYFQIAMLLLNFCAIMLMTIFVYLTTQSINERFMARQFLGGVNAIPAQPLQNVFICLGLLLVLSLSFFLRKRFFEGKLGLIYASFAIDFLISFIIIYLLDFNYNGIILFVFANLVTYSKGNKLRTALMMLAIISFLATDFEFMAINTNLYSIRDYIVWHSPNIQQYLFSVYNGFISLNSILFILYCTYEIMSQRGTIEEVNYLYGKLSEVNQDLENANEQLREYASITEKMGETKERNRLAREIHDTLGHTLTGISAGIDACITTLEVSPELTRKQLDAIARVTREGIVDVRRSVSKLRADSKERLPLEHAITKMVTDMQEITEAKIYFTNKVGNLNFDEDKENAIYRVVQESLTNAIRHGKAKQIWIEIKRDEHFVYLSIIDNGLGCAEIQSGFGLHHIKERIQMLGGEVEFSGAEGFNVHGKIPIRWKEEMQ